MNKNFTMFLSVLSTGISKWPIVLSFPAHLCSLAIEAISNFTFFVPQPQVKFERVKPRQQYIPGPKG